MKKDKIQDALLRNKITAEYTKFREDALYTDSLSDVYYNAFTISNMFEIYLLFQRSLDAFSDDQKNILQKMPNILHTIHECWQKTEDDSQNALAQCVHSCIEYERDWDNIEKELRYL